MKKIRKQFILLTLTLITALLVCSSASAADIEVNKTVNDTLPLVNDTIEFDITATNVGDEDATGVQVTDQIPAGLEYISHSGGTYDSNTGIWNIGNLAIGASQTLSIECRVLEPGVYRNNAQLSAIDQVDTNPANSFQDVEVRVCALVFHLESDAQLVNWMPNGNLAFVPESRYGNNGLSGDYELDIHTIDPNFTVRAQAQRTWSNGVPVNFSLSYNPVNTTVTYTVGPNTITWNGVYLPFTDMAIRTRATRAGSSILVNNLVLTDSLGNVIEISNLYSNGYSEAVAASGGLDILWIRANDLIDQFGVNLQNGFTLTGTQTMTWNPANPPSGSQLAYTIKVGKAEYADLLVEKTVDNPRPNLGETVTFTLTVTNLGQTTATNVQVTDKIPSGLTCTGHSTPSKGTCDVANAIWNIGDLAPGESATVDIYALANTAGTWVNSAAVSEAGTPDPCTNNNEAHVTVSVGQPEAEADVAITKTVNNPKPNLGDTVTFTLTVTNLYQQTQATGVVVNDKIPTNGLICTGHSTPSKGTCDVENATWTIGTLDPGESATVDIYALVIATGTFVNTATVSTETLDPNPTNNEDSASVMVNPAARLEIEKTVTPANVTVGKLVNFSIIVRNNDPDIAVDTYVTDKLPTGLTYISSSANYGSYNPTTGIWTIGDLPNGSVAVLNITARAEKAGVFINKAVVVSGTYDPEIGPKEATAQVNVTEPRPVPVNGKTVPMQKTGLNLLTVTLSILAILGGLIYPTIRK
ncbi:MAG: DUF11 domain-containing protein [Methanomicrobiales archaeon]